MRPYRLLALQLSWDSCWRCWQLGGGPVELAVGVGQREAGGGIGHADVLDVRVDGREGVVDDVDVADGAPAHVEGAEIGRGQCQLQEAAVGGRKFQPLDVEVRLLDARCAKPGRIPARR